MHSYIIEFTTTINGETTAKKEVYQTNMKDISEVANVFFTNSFHDANVEIQESGKQFLFKKQQMSITVNSVTIEHPTIELSKKLTEFNKRAVEFEKIQNEFQNYQKKLWEELRPQIENLNLEEKRELYGKITTDCELKFDFFLKIKKTK